MPPSLRGNVKCIASGVILHTCVVSSQGLVLYHVKNLCCIKLKTCVVSSQGLVLYQVRNLCCIKLRTCVVSSQDIVLYHFLYMSSCIEVRCLYCDLMLYKDWNLVLYQNRGIVLYQNFRLVLYQVYDSHRWYPMRMDLQLWIWTCVVSIHLVILCDILLVMVTKCYKSPLGLRYPYSELL